MKNYNTYIKENNNNLQIGDIVKILDVYGFYKFLKKLEKKEGEIIDIYKGWYMIKFYNNNEELINYNKRTYNEYVNDIKKLIDKHGYGDIPYYFFHKEQLEYIGSSIQGTIEEWDEINENKDNDFKIGDEILVSGVQNGVHFNYEPGEIINTSYGIFSVQFKRPISEIDERKHNVKRGHSGLNNKGKNGYCWNFNLSSNVVDFSYPIEGNIEEWDE